MERQVATEAIMDSLRWNCIFDVKYLAILDSYRVTCELVFMESRRNFIHIDRCIRQRPMFDIIITYLPT